MRTLPPQGASLRDAVQAINDLSAGRSNASGQVTLTPNVATTTIVGPNVNENAEVFLFPRTASAATEVGAGMIYASITRIASVPTVTITHANSATADRTFAYVILGG
jgi:hypothetical protein